MSFIEFRNESTPMKILYNMQDQVNETIISETVLDEKESIMFRHLSHTFGIIIAIYITYYLKLNFFMENDQLKGFIGISTVAILLPAGLAKMAKIKLCRSFFDIRTILEVQLTFIATKIILELIYLIQKNLEKIISSTPPSVLSDFVLIVSAGFLVYIFKTFKH